jgi:hypothetical protein
VVALDERKARALKQDTELFGRFELPVEDGKYPGGEAGVVRACSASRLLVSEVVLAVHTTKDTVVRVGQLGHFASMVRGAASR